VQRNPVDEVYGTLELEGGTDDWMKSSGRIPRPDHAVETNVLIDVFGAESEFGGRSRDALREARDRRGHSRADVVPA